jgi:hypothetical protein
MKNKVIYKIDNKIINEIYVVDDLQNLTQDVFEGFFYAKNLRPACYPICIKKINYYYEHGQRVFKFYINPYKLVWFIPEEYEKEYAYTIKEKNCMYLSMRDFNMFDIGI